MNMSLNLVHTARQVTKVGNIWSWPEKVNEGRIDDWG
ncbi:MAG: hypothetical protein MRERC_9c036 [Mycoplasmataceae bacterium RC_NB112A]|nr:MAG: hypothetical protein MRERC_9c036 [Mycoplasmataceae bacterium RC_NB112A]